MKTASQRLWPLLLLAAAPAATSTTTSATPFNCEKLEADGHTYNLHGLAGPHTVVTHEYARPTYHNTTYTLDLCAPLKRKGEVPREEACPDGTRGGFSLLTFKEAGWMGVC